jgi:subtilisin family serine protease
VVNISLGGPIDSAFVREAIRIARVDFGALVVAATGSSGASDVAYPARYDEVLAVGATRADGITRAPFSNAGPSVDVVAIGERIVGTVPASACGGRFSCLEPEGDDRYAIGDGTSFAAPIVSGAAALVIARFPFLPPDAVAGLLRSTADTVPPSDVPEWAGGGRLNMLRAVQLPYRIGGAGVSRN